MGFRAFPSLPLMALCASVLAPVSAAAQPEASVEDCLRMQRDVERLRQRGQSRMAAACLCHPQPEPLLSCDARCSGPTVG